LAYELSQRGLPFERERTVPITYRSAKLECGYRLDFVVKDEIIVEVKAVESLNPVHEAQLLTYLKLTGVPTGLLVNFNTAALRQGLRRLTLKKTNPS
jgi:GxxExxY protein